MSSGSNNSSSNSNPRQVIIDDDDHHLHYNGSWAKSNGKSITFNNKKLQTVPYDNSLHGTQGDGSFSLSYSFHGTTDGKVMGFADVSKSSGKQDPTWECVLDGKPIKTNDPPDSPTNQFSFCEWTTDKQGKHTIAVNVKSQGKQFFFDQITYVPDPKQTVKNATVLVGHSDRALMFQMFGNMTGSRKSGNRMAMSGGYKVTFPFTGTGLSWFGKVKNEDGPHMPTGYYSIDGQPPVNFTANPPPGKGSHTTLFFKTPSHLSFGNHNITVASVGEPQSAHLSLSYLVLENGQLPPPEIRLGLPPSDGTSDDPDDSSPFTTTSFPYPTLPSQSGNTVGQASDSGPVSDSKNFPFTHIITAMSGTLFLVLLAGVLLVIRRRRRMKMTRVESPESAIPSPIQPTPTGSSSRSAPPPYTPPQDMTQVASPEYPFAMAGNRFTNFAKRFTSSTSSSNRPNSLFQSSRPLSPLPTKRMSFASSAGSSTRAYRPYVSRPRSNTRSSTGSTATLLPNESISERESEPPSRKASLRLSFPDDQTVVEEAVEHKDGHMGMWHARPPEGRESPPPSDGGG